MLHNQFILPLSVNGPFDFEHFYLPDETETGGINNDNRALVAQLRRIDTSVYVWGGEGSGVTHLLKAAMSHQSDLGRHSLYIGLENLFDSDGFGLEALCQYEVLAIDNLDRLAGNLDWQMALFAIYNARFDLNKVTLFGAHTSPRNLALSVEDLRSRLSACAVWCVHPLTDEQRASAMQKRAQGRGFELTDAAADFLMKRVSRDLSSLMRLLDRLDETSIRLQKNKITVPLIKSALEER